MCLPVVYRSTDPSAPVLTGQAGALTALLKACLVDGYGAQVTAGWTSASSGTNARRFTQGGGNGFDVNVNDNGPGAGTFKEARAVGEESVGGNLFPTVVQLAAGIIIRKSATADGTARPWVLVADDRTFYLFVQTGDTAGVYEAFAFGDLFSLLSADGYRTMIIGRVTENSALTTNDTLDLLENGGATPANLAGHYFARAFTQVGGAVQFGKHGDGNMAGATFVLQGTMPFPNPTDGGLYLSRVYVVDNTTTPTHSRRGYLRGFYHWVHPVGAVIDGDTFAGTPGSEFAGRDFLVVKSSGSSGLFVIETTNWDTSA